MTRDWKVWEQESWWQKNLWLTQRAKLLGVGDASEKKQSRVARIFTEMSEFKIPKNKLACVKKAVLSSIVSDSCTLKKEKWKLGKFIVRRSCLKARVNTKAHSVSLIILSLINISLSQVEEQVFDSERTFLVSCSRLLSMTWKINSTFASLSACLLSLWGVVHREEATWYRHNAVNGRQAWDLYLCRSL